MTENLPASRLLTFLIADVRGYTRFTQERGDEAAAQLATEFARVTRTVVDRHDGEVIELRGDEALAIFPSTRQAVRAALVLQETYAIAAERDSGFPLRVGIGLDAGDAIPVEGGYRGGALNLAARLCSLAGAGEVFGSEGVMHLARQMDDVTFHPRGTVVLKGMAQPVPVMQVARTGSAIDFRPLQGTEPAPSNLRAMVTQFVGRHRELSEIAAQIEAGEVRLLTLYGMGGTGKTRLALEVARMVEGHFSSGAFLVELATTTDAAQVATALAAVLGLPPRPDQPVLHSVVRHLKDTHALIILDTMEHLMDAASDVAELLAECPRLVILATSREVLRLGAERVYEVSPLALPAPQWDHNVEALSSVDSVALFVERARSGQSSFTLTSQNSPDIARICRQLDGLPLALELAAARLRLFSPAALAARLEGNLSLLTAGVRDAPDRQQTLRRTIDWSFQLLAPQEQQVFLALGVCSGGCSLEALEIICHAAGIQADVLSAVASLIDKSLVRRMDSGEEEVRASLLRTVAAYARERLIETGAEHAVREAHAKHFGALAEETGHRMQDASTDIAATFRLLDLEHDNFRSALQWSLAHNGTERAARMAVALSPLWFRAGYIPEGIDWLVRLLNVSPPLPALHMANTLNAFAGLTHLQGRYDDTHAHSRRAFDIYQSLGDQEGMANSLRTMGASAMFLGRHAEATGYLERSLALFEALGIQRRITTVLTNLGDNLVREGRFVEAANALNRAMIAARASNDPGFRGYVLYKFGVIALEEERIQEANSLLREFLSLARGSSTEGEIFSLEFAAALASHGGDYARCGRLVGAASVVRDRVGALPVWTDRTRNEMPYLHRARESLGDALWYELVTEGAQLGFESAVMLLLGTDAVQ